MTFWQQRNVIAWLLLPFSFIFGLGSQIRRIAYYRGWLARYRASLPIVIVGNITVGGNGKTPVVVALAQQLTALGLKVGIISRGYGGKTSAEAILVTAQSDSRIVGDEPILIAQRTHCPVAVNPNRQASIELLQQHYSLDLIISDDGLQHYRLQRDIEIVVIDGQRRFGNGFLLPAGPLREKVNRLRTVDICICNGGQSHNHEIAMFLHAKNAINLVTQEVRALDYFVSQNVIAMAGIGYPPRFFTMLREHNIYPMACYALADHQQISLSKLMDMAQQEQILLMTEKDAVKYRHCAQPNWWFVPVEAEFDAGMTALLNKIQNKVKNHE